MPYKHGRSFEDYVAAPLERFGTKKWRKEVSDVMDQLKKHSRSITSFSRRNAKRLNGCPRCAPGRQQQRVRRGPLIWQEGRNTLVLSSPHRHRVACAKVSISGLLSHRDRKELAGGLQDLRIFPHAVHACAPGSRPALRGFRYLQTVPLIIGSIVPDLPYFLRDGFPATWLAHNETHTLVVRSCSASP